MIERNVFTYIHTYIIQAYLLWVKMFFIKKKRKEKKETIIEKKDLFPIEGLNSSEIGYDISTASFDRGASFVSNMGSKCD